MGIKKMTSVEAAAQGKVGPNGYNVYANPETKGKNVADCTKQDSKPKEFNLYNRASLKDDPVAVDLDIIQSQGPGNYYLNNTYGCDCELKDAREVQLSQVMVNFQGGVGWMGEKGCLI